MDRYLFLPFTVLAVMPLSLLHFSSLSCHFFPITLLFYLALIWLHYLHLLTCPPLPLPLFFPCLSASALLIHPPTYHRLSLRRQHWNMSVCMWISSECAHNFLALGAVCEAIFASVRVLWGRRGRQGWRGEGVQFERVKSI